MFIFAEQIVPSDECLHGDDSSSGPANPDLVTQPGLGLHSYQSSELQFAEQVQQVQVQASNLPGTVTCQYLRQARASASANNSPQPALQAGDTVTEDADTQPPRIMGDQPDPTQSAFITSLQAVHDITEAQRVEAAKLHDQLAAANAKTMEETIKRLEAEKAAIEAKNVSLQVTADAAKATKDAAEAAAAAAASGSSGGGGISTSAADTIAKALSKAGEDKLTEECVFPCGITYPEWPAFDPSVKFDEGRPAAIAAASGSMAGSVGSAGGCRAAAGSMLVPKVSTVMLLRTCVHGLSQRCVHGCHDSGGIDVNVVNKILAMCQLESIETKITIAQVELVVRKFILSKLAVRTSIFESEC